MSAQNSIVIDGVSKTYRGSKAPALESATWSASAGQVLALIGPNGAGKTTMMGCLLGLLSPDTGSVRFDGLDPDDLRVKRQLGYLPERLTFSRWVTGLRFMRDQCALAGVPADQRVAQSEALLASVGLEKDRWGQAIKKYSYGMLRRLGLAQAMIGKPRYLLLDEPVSGLDPAGVATFRKLFLDVKAWGGTVIFTSHQLDQVVKVSDRILFIKGGHVQEIESRDVEELEKLFLPEGGA